MSTKFFGKTTEMDSNIFDVRSRQGASFLLAQDELSKFVSINNLKGNRASNAIKDLRQITYTEPPKPTFKDEAGSDLSNIEQKLELYKYEPLLKKLKKEKVDDNAIMKRHMSSPMENTLKQYATIWTRSQDLQEFPKMVI